jgi:hypothetical protein
VNNQILIRVFTGTKCRVILIDLSFASLFFYQELEN